MSGKNLKSGTFPEKAEEVATLEFSIKLPISVVTKTNF
jgi:hypothetical protein